MIRTRCPLPAASALLEELPGATYVDAYAAAWSAPGWSMVDFWLAVFGRPPALARFMMALGGALVAPFGLRHPGGKDARPRRPADYAPGDTIRGWTIARLTADEMIAGMDDRHLDFRVSLMRVDENGDSVSNRATSPLRPQGEGEEAARLKGGDISARAAPSRIVLATAVKTHNLLGRAYLALILPFHRAGVPWLLARAGRRGMT